MKTKLTTIAVIVMALNLIPMAMAANGRPGRGARDGFDGPARGGFRPGVMAQMDTERPEFAPGQALRPQVRPFIQRYMQNRRQNIAPQAFAPRGQGYGRGFEAQARPFARENFRGRDRMERPFRAQGDCPFCGQGMGQARHQGGRRQYAQQEFAPRGQGRMMDRPFRAQRQNRFIQEENDRPYGPQAFHERAQRGQLDGQDRQQDRQPERPFRGRGMGMGRLEQDEDDLAQPPLQAPQGRRQGRNQGRGIEDAQEDQIPQPQARPQQEQLAPQRQRRDRQQFRDMQDDEEPLQVQPRAGLRRNAQ